MKQDEKKQSNPKNQQPIHKKSSSYGGFGGNSPANMNGAINEFEDNLNVDLNNDPENESDSVSETNRLDRPDEEEENNPENKPDSENLNRKRAEGFEGMKKDIGTTKQTDTKNKQKK